jgi:hypothetical protein
VQRGRAWLVLLLVLAAAGGAWYSSARTSSARSGSRKALETGPTLTPIRDVVAAPARFQGKELTVQGTVSSTSEVVMSSGAASRFYTLKGEGGEIVVTVRERLPTRGQTLVVTGVVAEAPKGKGLAPRLAEKRREHAPAR